MKNPVNVTNLSRFAGNLSLATSCAVLICVASASAQEAAERTGVFCKRDSTVSIEEYTKTTVPDGYSDLKTYELNTDFRSPKNDVPWSESKIFNDPVTGAYVGVIDRNFIPNASRIHTSWHRDVIIAEGMDITPYFFKRYQFDVLMIPAGGKYLVLRGCNGRFPVNQRVANALISLPDGKPTFVKLYTPEFSGAILNEIGPGTVKAWKKVYANWSKQAASRPSELGF
jgi:hypothetical protein